MISQQILASMFLRGLGELLTLHVAKDRVLVGNVVVEKGRLVFKDRDYMGEVLPARVETCIDSGVLGVLCDIPGENWETLTFLGPQHCDIPTDLSATRTGLLAATKAKDGSTLMDFRGSWYRAFDLLVENHFLPVASTIPIPTKQHGTGLAVCDLKLATVPLVVLERIHDAVTRTIDKYATFEVRDISVEDADFNELFGAYLAKQG